MTAQQTYDIITLPNGGWATGKWSDNFGGPPKFDTYETDIQTSLNNGLSGFLFPNKPNPFGSILPLPSSTPRQVDPREIFNPLGIPGGLAGKYMGAMGMGGMPVWAGALGGLIGAGLDFFDKRKRR